MPKRRKTFLAAIPRIDVAVVEKFGKLELELRKLGVEIKPSYGIEPPLGRNRHLIHNRSRAWQARCRSL